MSINNKTVNQTLKYLEVELEREFVVPQDWRRLYPFSCVGSLIVVYVQQQPYLKSLYHLIDKN